MEKINLKIEGMHCGACATGIEMLLANKKGVSKIKIDYDQKTGELEFEPEKIKLADILKSIQELGYTAIE